MEGLILDLERCRTSGDGMEQDDLQEKVDLTELSTKTNTQNQVSTVSEADKESKDSIVAVLDQKQKSRESSSSSSTKVNQGLPLPGLHTLYRRPEYVTRSIKPVVPKGELILLKPRLVKSKKSLPEHKKTKPPKFIPYEPYPGAVTPIEATKKSHGSVPSNTEKSNRNNLDIAVLVSQMSTIRSHELHHDSSVEDTDKQNNSTIDCKEAEQLKEELKKVKEERDYFQCQYKFQTQVNAELKNLLVASVGEDLLTRVNVLTEDKLQLARALLDTAKNLTTHTEQIEFLAGQCEVWRSKFLASSVMVEELARWKADLTQKNQMLNEATKRLLHSTHELREMQLEILKNLKFVAKIRYLNLPATDVITLSAENINILQQMVLHSGVGMPEGDLTISSASTSPLCESEKYAVQALEFISQPLIATDEAIRAVFDQTQKSYAPHNAASLATGDELDSNKLKK